MSAKPLDLIGVLVSSLVVPIGTAQQVHTVGEGESLQAAVDAAEDGDVLLISGVDPGPTLIDGKSLVLQGEGDGPLVRALGIQNLAADQSIVLRGLEITGYFPSEWWNGSVGLRISDCLGEVWIEDCEVGGAFEKGARIQDSAAVIWIRSSAQGGANLSYFADGSHGVHVLRSAVYAYESEFRGGAAGAAPGAGNEHVSGGAGMRLRGSSLFASGSEFEGASSYCCPALCDVWGWGGSGLELYTNGGVESEVFTIDCTYLPGGPFLPGVSISGSGIHTELEAAPCGLTMSSPVQEGESLEASLFGTPDSLALIGLSLSPRAFFALPLAGSLLLDDPSLVYHALVLDEEGLGTLTLPFASLGGSVDAIQTFHQAGLLLPTLDLQLCSATSVLLLSAAF